MIPELDSAVTRTAPLVSVMLANYNGARFIEAALTSVLTQTLREIEVLFVDDGSTDDSVARVAGIAARDPRVRMFSTPFNAGPAAARNVALDVAAGEWIAVMDSDDLMHPDRLARLVAAAEANKADIVADDLLIFDEDDRVPPFSALGKRRRPCWIDAVTYVRGNFLFGRAPAIGYLKPLFRAALIHQSRLRYDPRLRVAEDYDFTLRLLARGARFRICPELTYFYRKHTGSISYRLSPAKLFPMLAADDAFRVDFGTADPLLTRALDQRRQSILRAIDFDSLLTALKQRRWRAALSIVRHRPGLVPMLRMPMLARLRRWRLGEPKPEGNRPRVCIISRQRLIGAPTSLLSLATTLASNGFDVHLVCPFPMVFGQLPVLLLRGEMRVFRTVLVRGGWRIGPAICAHDPRVLVSAVTSALGRLIKWLGWRSTRPVVREPCSVAVSWLPSDLLFVARHARRNADLILIGDAVLTEVIPYALRPDATSAVVMHGVASRQCGEVTPVDDVDSMASARKAALLSRADALIALHADEATFARLHLPGKRVILSPAVPEPGSDRRGRRTPPCHGEFLKFADAAARPVSTQH